MQILYKGIEFSTDKNDMNYIEPTMPNRTRKCKSCGDVMKIRPLDTPYLRTPEGLYLVHRTERGVLHIKNVVPVDILYGCKSCSFAESVRIEKDKFIEV